MYAPSLAKLRASPIEKIPAPETAYEHRNAHSRVLSENKDSAVSFCATASSLPLPYPDRNRNTAVSLTTCANATLLSLLTLDGNRALTRLSCQKEVQIVKEQNDRPSLPLKASCSVMAPTRKWWSQAGSNRRPPACKAGALPAELWPHELVGLGRFELPTSPLSGVRSNQLSYRPKVTYA